MTYREDGEHGIIGICNICGNEIYNSDNYDYNGVYSMVHNSCKREQLRTFINKYNNRTGHEPKRFKVVRD